MLRTLPMGYVFDVNDVIRFLRKVADDLEKEQEVPLENLPEPVLRVWKRRKFHVNVDLETLYVIYTMRSMEKPMSYRVIARHLNISATAVQKYAREMGV